MIRQAQARARRRFQLDGMLANALKSRADWDALIARLEAEQRELERTRAQDEAELDEAWKAMTS